MQQVQKNCVPSTHLGPDPEWSIPSFTAMQAFPTLNKDPTCNTLSPDDLLSLAIHMNKNEGTETIIIAKKKDLVRYLLSPDDPVRKKNLIVYVKRPLGRLISELCVPTPSTTADALPGLTDPSLASTVINRFANGVWNSPFRYQGSPAGAIAGFSTNNLMLYYTVLRAQQTFQQLCEVERERSSAVLEKKRGRKSLSPTAKPSPPDDTRREALADEIVKICEPLTYTHNEEIRSLQAQVSCRKTAAINCIPDVLGPLADPAFSSPAQFIISCSEGLPPYIVTDLSVWPVFLSCLRAVYGAGQRFVQCKVCGRFFAVPYGQRHTICSENCRTFQQKQVKERYNARHSSDDAERLHRQAYAYFDYRIRSCSEQGLPASTIDQLKETFAAFRDASCSRRKAISPCCVDSAEYRNYQDWVLQQEARFNELVQSYTR